MPNSMFPLLALWFFTLPPQQSALPSATPALQVVPVDAARMVNPITPTHASLAKAKSRYAIDCAMCHGANGDGKGDPGIISDMGLTMMDFTNPETLKGRTDGEIFYITKNGMGKMPPEDRANNSELWNLVVYLRSLSKK